ncbi:hypothetical protein MXM08_02635 [Aeromonas sanarellii]|uniref:hypothetical protein n=1 Tax=Aeromonas sanarellii TaxID=633415 RepID=UPI002DB60329|nr:hypothetical protein [Aeromonas sanarellii]MEB6605469.1 hypothetical protein [Aeromonas sanarellii]
MLFFYGQSHPVTGLSFLALLTELTGIGRQSGLVTVKALQQKSSRTKPAIMASLPQHISPMIFFKKTNFNIKNCYAILFNLFLIIKKLITHPFKELQSTIKTTR